MEGVLSLDTILTMEIVLLLLLAAVAFVMARFKP
jgi:hypothetical protein